MNVPVVVLVAEGDLNTLDVVVEVLEKCIPVYCFEFDNGFLHTVLSLTMALFILF
jgi:hypothetical protein